MKQAVSSGEVKYDIGEKPSSYRSIPAYKGTWTWITFATLEMALKQPSRLVNEHNDVREPLRYSKRDYGGGRNTS
ncbi:hypothetical protein NTGM5_20011 [Candidatus Nitrotoga sp. M5]|nr:hypothetical protein NTGM5_20011 [Candidatus Nitrotoga sp. M5]